MPNSIEVTPTSAQDELYLLAGWAEGDDPDSDLTFDLSSGAGFGSLIVHLTVTKNGWTIREKIDFRPVLTTWINNILKEQANGDRS